MIKIKNLLFEKSFDVKPISVNALYKPIRTVNKLNQTTTRQIKSREAREFKKIIGYHINRYHKLITDKNVEFEINLYFPDKRKRDIDNYVKAILDCFTGIIIKDDSQVKRLVVNRNIEKKRFNFDVKIYILGED